MKDKVLFSVLIKYHPQIIGRLINKGIIDKEDDGLFMHKEEGSAFRGMCFSLVSKDNKKIIDSGIKLFRSRYVGSDCLLTNLQFVMENFGDKLYFIHLPEGFPRLDNNLKDIYIKIIENNVCEIKNRYPNIYNIPGIYNYVEMAGHTAEWWYNNILLKHGIFAYSYLYYEIEWDFDMVEKYKDKILWVHLFEDSNLLWSEERMLQFDSYIPHKELGKRFLQNRPRCYCNVQKLSNSYIDSHKDVINWAEFIETAEFEWNSEDMKYFNEYVTKGGQYIINLTRNDRFKWTPDNLRALIELDPDAIEVIAKDKKLVDVFLTIPDYKKLLEDYNASLDILLKMKDGGEQPHNAYSSFFTIDNIQKNLREWDEILENKFITNRRTPDTNYHYHRAYTMWDYFSQNASVTLTYELSKYLQTITVNIGGMYIMEDGCYLGEDHRNQKFNGFYLFANHKISSNEEIEKICNDSELLDAFMKKANTDIIDYLIDAFFKDYKVEDYISIINNLKDWSQVHEF